MEIFLKFKNNKIMKKTKSKIVVEELVPENSIFTIFPYKDHGQWVFDDEKTGLYKEAFVAGADDLLDMLCEGADKCTAMFSATSFPDHQLSLLLVHSDEGGSDYFCEKFKHNLWLCNALLKYYPKAPQVIYLKIKKSK